jgi:hypothetical protein
MKKPNQLTIWLTCQWLLGVLSLTYKLK